MSLNRRTFIGGTTAVGTGILATKYGSRVWETLKDLGTGLKDKMLYTSGVEDLIFNARKGDIPRDAHRQLVESLSKELGCPPQNIHALLIQERAKGQKNDFFQGETFGIDNNKPAILFERHVFWRNIERGGEKIGISNLRGKLKECLTNEDDDIFKNYDPFSRTNREYGKSSEQYERLRHVYRWGENHSGKLAKQTGKNTDKIKNIIEDSALMACSWGAGQILGENYREIGCSSVKQLVQNASTLEGMAENMAGELGKKKPFYFNGVKHDLIAELKKEQPNWQIIAVCHNGKNTKKVNPDYASNAAGFAQEYSPDNPILKYIQEESQKDATKLAEYAQEYAQKLNINLEGNTTNVVLGGTLGAVLGILANKIRGRGIPDDWKNEPEFKSVSRRTLFKTIALGVGGSFALSSLMSGKKIVKTKSKKREEPVHVNPNESGDIALEDAIQTVVDEYRSTGKLKDEKQEKTAWASFDIKRNTYDMSINLDTEMRAASIIKPFIILAWLLKNQSTGIPAQKRAQFESMILYNKGNNPANTDTTKLMNELGGPANVQNILADRQYHLPDEFIKGLHIEETIPDNGQTYKNTITARCIVSFYQHLYSHRNQEPYKALYELMKIPKYDRIVDRTSIPVNISSVNKSGATGACNVVGGIIDADGDHPYIFFGGTSISSKITEATKVNPAERSPLIRRVSSMVYEYRKKIR